MSVVEGSRLFLLSSKALEAVIAKPRAIHRLRVGADRSSPSEMIAWYPLNCFEFDVQIPLIDETVVLLLQFAGCETRKVGEVAVAVFELGA